MRIVSASFYWRNDHPDGLGFTLNESVGWSSDLLTESFTGKSVADYFRESDAQLGTEIVAEYLGQLQAIARKRPKALSFSEVVIAALNIMWLTERGFIPNDDFNGLLFIKTM